MATATKWPPYAEDKPSLKRLQKMEEREFSTQATTQRDQDNIFEGTTVPPSQHSDNYLAMGRGGGYKAPLHSPQNSTFPL